MAMATKSQDPGPGETPCVPPVPVEQISLDRTWADTAFSTPKMWRSEAAHAGDEAVAHRVRVLLAVLGPAMSF